MPYDANVDLTTGPSSPVSYRWVRLNSMPLRHDPYVVNVSTDYHLTAVLKILEPGDAVEFTLGNGQIVVASLLAKEAI